MTSETSSSAGSVHPIQVRIAEFLTEDGQMDQAKQIIIQAHS